MAVNMLPTNPLPNNEISHDWTPNVDIIRFGDGYTQRHVQGIKAETKTYTLQYSSLTKAERDTIYNFITARAGAIAFGFKFLGEPAARIFICYDGVKERRLPGQFFDLEFEMEEVKDIDTVVA
jgi:phage-related protein